MQNDITGQPPCDGFVEKRVSVIGRISRLVNISISTTAGDVYLADSAQVPRVHVQVNRGNSRGVFGHGRGVKLHEEESKYTEVIAEVYLPYAESTLLRSRPSKHPQLLYL